MKHFSKRLLMAGALAATILCRSLQAQPPVAPPNRVLFVVETSWAMRQQLPAARECVRELMASGLQGQLRAGDTIGVWTYDSELRAGNFPMQIWTDGQQGRITEAVDFFLNRLKATGSGRLELALPEVLRLIGESEAITVLLISDGRATMSGTPFDDSINEVWRQHRKEMQAARIPFVTVLVARAGKIVNCNVNSATAVSMPALPPTSGAKLSPVPPATASVSAPIPAPAPAPVQTNPPLVVDYSKANLNGAVKTVNGNTPASHPVVEVLPPPPPTNEVVILPVALASGLIESAAPPQLTTSTPAIVTQETIVIAPPRADSDIKSSTTSPPAPAAPVATANAPEPPSPAAAAPQRVAAVPPPGRSGWLVALIGGAALGLAGVVGCLLARRRAAARAGGSLITKSFDQRKR